jgi:hypothetical protein
MKFRVAQPWPVAARVIENGTIVDVAKDAWAQGKIPPSDAVALDQEAFDLMTNAYPKTKISFDRTYERDDRVLALVRARLRRT